MSTVDDKKPQPPALRLANADRSLRAHARNYATWLREFRGSIALDFRAVDDAHEALQKAALNFAAAYHKCNKDED